MKKLLLATTAVLLAAPALAADLPRRSAAVAPAPMMVGMNWTGFYVGLNVGYVGVKELGTAAVNIQPTGFTVGARLGYDWQVSPSWVVGLMGDLDAGFIDDNLSALATVEAKVPLLASLNLRVGYLITPATLLYATGGFTYADVKVSGVNIADLPSSASGWNLGLGVEHRFNSNWSVFGEYRYTQLRLDSMPAAAAALGRDADAHVFKLGVNYRFGGPAGPVVARY